MSIEVRQMTVKTSIVSPDKGTPEGASRPSGVPGVDMQQVLAACRQMVEEMLRERRER